MKMPCWHRFKWTDAYEVEMEIVKFLQGVVIGEPITYIENKQRGHCEKCGLIKERKLS